jgi:hypothetical protein
MTHTIVHCYSNKCKTVELSPGIADFLKGSLYLFQQSKLGDNHFQLYIDFSHHPIKKFIKDTNLKDKCNQEGIIECFNENRHIIRSIVKSAQTGNTQSDANVICHEPYRNFNYKEKTELDEDEKQFMKNVLSFEQTILDEYNYLKSNLLLKDKEFCVVHIRMGDGESKTANVNVAVLELLENYIKNIIIPKWGNERIVILSDCFATKHYLSDKYKLKYTSFIPVHLGQTKIFADYIKKNTEEQDIANTLIEFILMSESKTVYLYSIYGGSGFSKLCCDIYDIPYIKLT